METILETPSNQSRNSASVSSSILSPSTPISTFDHQDIPSTKEKKYKIKDEGTDDAVSIAPSVDTVKMSNAHNFLNSNNRTNKKNKIGGTRKNTFMAELPTTPERITNQSILSRQYQMASPAITPAVSKKNNKNVLKKTGKALQRIWARPQSSNNNNSNNLSNLTNISRSSKSLNNHHNFLNSKRNSSSQHPLTSTQHHQSQPQGLRPRHFSEDNTSRQSNSPKTKSEDDVILGKLDGLDVISLGAARNVSFISPKQARFAGQRYTLRSMVSDSLPYGKTKNVMVVLEGYVSRSRWTVQIQEYPSTSTNGKVNSSDTRSNNNRKSATASAPTTDNCSVSSDSSSEKVKENIEENNEDDVSTIPTHILLSQMWGKNNAPPPSNNLMIQFPKQTKTSEYLVAANCPVDVDEDLFIIDSFDHLQNIVDIAAAPIRNGCFQEAIEIFEKILLSLKAQQANNDPTKPIHSKSPRSSNNSQILIGSTYHNIGVLQMWAGLYEDALINLKEAVNTRVKVLSEYHPSVAVSCTKLGIVQFALEQLDSALESFERAYKIQRLVNSSSNLELSKIINNLGVTYYQRGDFSSALKYLTECVEIQRKWLNGSIRRESNVYEASVTLCNMGKVYLEKNDYDMSFYVYEEALMLQTSSFKKDHNAVLSSLGNIAFARAKKGEKSKALQIYKGVHRSQVGRFGSGSREAVETIGLMSVLYIQQGNFNDAIKCLFQVLNWQKENLDEHHLAIRNTKRTIRKLKNAANSKSSNK